MSKHTFDEWYIDNDTVGEDAVGRVQILAEGIGFIAAVGDLEAPEPNNTLANARLIVTAPQLLEALRKIIESGVHVDCPACKIMYEIADNAIATATGDDNA